VILVDSSSWIHFLRPNGDPAVRARVESALTAGEACWCPLCGWNSGTAQPGARSQDPARLRVVLPELSIDDEVWAAADALARRARSSGVSVPATDILIAACARRHGADLETTDADFALLRSV